MAFELLAAISKNICHLTAITCISIQSCNIINHLVHVSDNIVKGLGDVGDIFRAH